MGMNKHNQDLMRAVQTRAANLVKSNLKYCDEGGKSESWLIQELEIGLFMEFYSKKELDVQLNDGAVVDLGLVRRALWREIYQTHRADGMSKPKLAYSSVPALSGILEPHIARRRDMTPSAMMVKAMEHFTSFQWHINQDLFNLILEYRESLGEEDRQRIFYDSHLDFLAGDEQNSERSLFDLLGRIGDTPFYIPWSRCDQSGRYYPAPMHPVYSRFLRACFWHKSEKLTDSGWQYLEECIKQEFGCEDLDSWSAGVIKRGINHLIDHDKDGADELSAAYGWKMARETGATGYMPYRDYAASGLGIMAAKEGIHNHRELVDVSHPRFVSAHDRLSATLKSFFGGLRDASLAELKATSKGILIPTQYAGGYRAIVSMLTGMEINPSTNEWDFGEFGDKLPQINNLLNQFVHGETDPKAQLKLLEAVCKRFAQACHRTFPFMRKYQTRVRSQWPKDWASSPMPVSSTREVDGWVRQPSPFRTERRLTRDVRISIKDGDTRIQPSIRVFDVFLDTAGIGECVRGIFQEDSAITTVAAAMHSDEGIQSTSIHDARACHPNHGYRLQQIEAEAYDRVMGTNLASCKAVLVRA